MKKCSQLESLKVIDVIEEEYSCELHAQDHFEIIYIHYGCGVHVFNEVTIPYGKGDLFLLAPGDRHYFTVKTVTRFTYIKFTSDYFETYHRSSKSFSQEITPTSIMQIQWLKEDKITVNEPCQTILKNIFENIILYNSTINVLRSSIVYYHILSIFGMIKEYLDNRNIELKKKTPTNAHIAAYIQANIYNRDCISIHMIANHFNISPSYFSTYFKRNFEISYKEYIEKIQIQLIKRRLETGEIKLKEIANEFDFTDVSHLSKFFKRREGLNPSEYKNTGK